MAIVDSAGQGGW